MCFPGILTKFFRIPLSDCLYLEAVTQKTLNMTHVSNHTHCISVKKYSRRKLFQIWKTIYIASF